jgi:hypothetical protein
VLQSTADCDGDVVAEGNVSAESSEQMISPAVADPPDVKTTLLRRRWKHYGPKPAKTLPREAV